MPSTFGNNGGVPSSMWGLSGVSDGWDGLSEAEVRRDALRFHDACMERIAGMDAPEKKKLKTSGLLGKIINTARSEVVGTQPDDDDAVTSIDEEPCENDYVRAQRVVSEARSLVPEHSEWEIQPADSAKTRMEKADTMRDLLAAIGVIQELTQGAITSGKITLTDRLYFFLLRYGDFVRSHEGELYEYERCGAWVNRKACSVNLRQTFNLVEGLLYSISATVSDEEWVQWAVVKDALKANLQQAATDCVSLLSHAKENRTIAKQHWDSNLRQTRGKRYNAHGLCKLAEIVAGLPEAYDRDFAKGDKSDLWKMFTSRFNTPKPRSHGFVFRDGFRDNSMSISDPAPENNCYFKLPFPYDKKNLRQSDCPTVLGRRIKLNDVQTRLLDFIASFFYNNDHFFAASVASTYNAFYEIHVPVMIYPLGEGEDGKGLFDILETQMLGSDNAAVLDPNIFTDDNEWRKSAHFGLHKRRVCFKEIKDSKTFNVDVWKRFIAGEELIVRANFGFSAEVKFRGMKKQQSCNYDDVPVVKRISSGSGQSSVSAGNDSERKDPTHSFGRRVIAASVGLAKLVQTQGETCAEEGRFLKVPTEELEAILSCTAAHTIYFRDVLEPVWNEYEGLEDPVRTLDIAYADDNMKAATEWLQQRLCGTTVNRRPRSSIEHQADGEVSHSLLTRLAECIGTLWRTMDKRPNHAAYLRDGRGFKCGEWKVAKQCAETLEVPKSRCWTAFNELKDACKPLSDYLVQTKEAENFFGGLQRYAVLYPVDILRLIDMMNKYNIPMPRCSPSCRWHLGYVDAASVVEEPADDYTNVAVGNIHVCDLADVLNIADLKRYAARQDDSRQQQLDSYIALAESRGQRLEPDNQDIITLPRSYKKITYGRQVSVGISLQKLTRAARKAALERLPGGAYELDIALCFLSLIVSKLKEVLDNDDDAVQARFPMLVHLIKHKGQWRAFVQEYFACEKDIAKQVFQTIMSPNGRQTPQIDDQTDWLPQLDAAQQEIVDANRLFAEKCQLYQDIAVNRPGSSTLHVMLGELESGVALEMAQFLEHQGAQPISLVFDGVYFIPRNLDPTTLAFHEAISNLGKRHGVELKIKNLNGDIVEPIIDPMAQMKIEHANPMQACAVDSDDEIEIISEILPSSQHSLPLGDYSERTSTRMVCFPGSHMCILSALLSMDVIAGESSQPNQSSGPYRYRDVMRLYPGLSLVRFAIEELLSNNETAVYILHIGVEGSIGHAVGLQQCHERRSYLLHDSGNSHVMQIRDEVLYDLLRANSTRVMLLRVFDASPLPPGIKLDPNSLDTMAGAFKPFPLHKRGTGRMKVIKSAMKKKTAAYLSVPYVRHGTPTVKSRGDRVDWAISLKKIYQMSGSDVIRRAIADGILENKEGCLCPKCCIGELGPLQLFDGRGLRYRCRAKKCQKLTLPQDNHPLFTVGSGSGYTPFEDQCAVLFCGLAGCSNVATKRITGMNHKMIEAQRVSFDREVALYVEREQNRIIFGDGLNWKDVEADEAVFGKVVNHEETQDKQVQWHQWAGIVQRGDPSTLVLRPTGATKTCIRAPGPGAIKKIDWKPFGEKYLKNRKVILHTDRAKAYALKIDGVIHDSVRHSRKRVKRGGKWVWVKPYFAKLVSHRTPDGCTIKCKSGTQIIDRLWQHVRKHTKGVNSTHHRRLEIAIRRAQWCYWKKDCDLWLACGAMLKANREQLK